MSISFQNQNSDVIWGEPAEMHRAHASAISHHACLDTIPFISLGLSFTKHSPGRNQVAHNACRICIKCLNNYIMRPWVLPAVGIKFLNKPSLSGLDTLQQRLSVTKGNHKEKAKFSNYREVCQTRDGGGKERWQYLTTAVLANSTLLSPPPPPPLAQHSASKEMGERVAPSCSPGHLDCQIAVSSHLCMGLLNCPK